MDPELFNAFINDMLSVVQYHVYNYADDNTLAEIDDDVTELMKRLQAETLNCMKWFNANFIKANPAKFQFMLMDRKYTHNVTLDPVGIQLKSQESVKMLGFKIDKRLTFDDHIETICKRTGRQLGVLQRLSKDLCNDEKSLICETYVLSNVSYCPIIWHFCSRLMEYKVERLQ